MEVMTRQGWRMESRVSRCQGWKVQLYEDVNDNENENGKGMSLIFWKTEGMRESIRKIGYDCKGSRQL